MLKKIAFLLLSLLPFTMFAASTADKIYVQLEDLTFDADGIWFKNRVNSLVVGAEAIHVDSFGYYVSNNEQTWLCPQCGNVNRGNYPGFWGCWNCGFPFR